MEEPEGKAAVVTGASRGIGAATAKEAARFSGTDFSLKNDEGRRLAGLIP